MLSVQDNMNFFSFATLIFGTLDNQFLAFNVIVTLDIVIGLIDAYNRKRVAAYLSVNTLIEKISPYGIVVLVNMFDLISGNLFNLRSCYMVYIIFSRGIAVLSIIKQYKNIPLSMIAIIDKLKDFFS